MGQLAGAHVWVVGDCMLDEYVSGDVRRVSPEAPIPVVNVDDTFSRLGGAAHVARSAAALGARVTLGAVIGKDPAGDTLLALCGEAGIDATAVVRVDDRPTTRKLRVLGQRQQLLRLDWESTQRCPDSLADPLVDALESGTPPTAIVVSDYAKGFVTDRLLARIVGAAEQHGIPLIVDPKDVDLSRYRGATVIKPNLVELEEALGVNLASASESDIADAAQSARETAGARAVVVTLGARGAVSAEADGTTAHHPAARRDVFDVSGAGDAVAAVLALGLGAGASLADSIELANLAAGITVSKVGVAVVRSDQLVKALRGQATSALGTRDEIRDRVADWKRNGRSVVFTNGCFDLLHAGHLALLRSAAELGDALVVGVNSEDSVRRLKGPGRPVVSEAERAALLAALDCVDAVVVFDEDTPLELLEALRPDVLVKGEDYRLEDVVGKDLVERYGGRVALVPLLPEHSTSALVERIRNRSD